ncbi:MAG TPA: choice-of-anchor tandem repeat GloVer-containing protein [Steroidobacteraceae bacterium]|nr:choice-of-anchor tandem repeat GloVer-containing protein [Steroidobacteraceae bacterium]
MSVANVQVAVVHEFHHPWRGLEGAEPGIVTIGRDGALYGTTAAGGTYGAGTVFRIKPGGAFETLHVSQFAVIGIGTQGTVVSRTSLTAFVAQGRPVFGLVAARDGYFYGLIQGWGRSAGADAPSLMYRLRPGEPVEQVQLFANEIQDPTLAGPIVPDSRDGSFYVTFRKSGVHHQGVIYRISVGH